MNPKIKLLLRIIVSFVLIVVLFKKVNVYDVLENIKNLNLFFVSLVFLFFVLNYVASSYRWKVLFLGKCKNLSVLYLFKLYYIGAFLSNFLPSTVGGDIYKAYKLGRDTNNMPMAISSTFMERLIGVFSLSVVSFLGVIFIWGVKGFIVLLFFWFLIILGFVNLKFFSKFSKKLKEFYSLITLYRNKKKALAKAFFYSLVVQIGSVFSHYFTSYALGIKLSLAFSFFAFPIIGFISFLPISLNGIGTQDGAYVFFFKYVNVSPELAVSVSILYHFLRVLNSAIGWVFLTLNETLRFENKTS